MPGGAPAPAAAGGASQWQSPYGQAGPPSGFALMASRYFDLYGCTNLDFADIAVNNRSNAEKNPRAIMRTPMTVEDHQNSRWIVYPLRLFDCCQETDAACAVVVSSADQAKTLRKPPVYISSAVGGSAPTPDLTITNAANIGSRLLSEADVTLKDIDVFQPYDCFSIMPILLVEDMGFCKKGEGYQFVKDGRISLDGELPMSTHGGLLSEGYVHGFNNVTELVQQLRWEAEDLCPNWRNGEHTFDRSICRQVRDPQIGLNVSVSGGSALVLRRG
jgi:acetyl-CoA acetyltransferase